MAQGNRTGLQKHEVYLPWCRGANEEEIERVIMDTGRG